MALDLSQDSHVVDDPVCLMYAAKVRDGTFADAEPVKGCQVMAITRADLAANPKLLEKESAVVHMWRRCMGFLKPVIGDKLEQQSVDGACVGLPGVWVVQSVGALDRDGKGPQRYRLVVTRSTGAQTL